MSEAPGFDTHRRLSAVTTRSDGALPLTVVLVRHGATPLTEAGGHSGSDGPGPSLTARGRLQAAQAADAAFRIGRAARTGAGSTGGMRSGGLWPDLPRPTVLVASPMVRTQETAVAVGRRLGLHVANEPRFAECRLGEWDGLTAAEIEQGWPGELAQWHATGTFVPPGGESYTQLGARVWDGLTDLLAGGVDRTVVAVGHAVQIRTAVGQALGAPASHWARLRVPPASLSVVRLWEDGTTEVTAVGVPTDG
ncbi:histidine phosphatase family protein [Promicromonospora iranensis]|uniref:Phosphoglycerate mutase n=1 Tax=Promicromonospora iranensis TaxID=1105144 RepID=A0ABU2CTZ1_9MICO|nr:histidine phosphatase family protein [Promicromonospora iranensis]MDR7384813.1 putative phosphoglycerate mutase [Promicromonospora iranensis]